MDFFTRGRDHGLWTPSLARCNTLILKQLNGGFVS